MMRIGVGGPVDGRPLGRATCVALGLAVLMLGCASGPGSSAEGAGPSPAGAAPPAATPGPAAGSGPAAGQKGTAAAIPVEVRPVETRTVTYSVQAIGSLEAREVIRIPARVAGVVQDISFEEGTAVTAGRVLARIDPERYRLAAARAAAELERAEAEAREAGAALDKRRALREKDPGWVTAEELSNYTAQLDQARAAATASRAALDLARKDLADSELKAESAGVINEKLISTGQFVTAGMAVATMVDTRRLKLSFTVAEAEAARLTAASPITFHVKGQPGRTFEARMYHRGESADPATRMLRCLAWVDNADGALQPGFFADVSIDLESRANAIVVPQTAVLPTDRGFIGFVLEGGDRVRERSLRLGLHTRDDAVEILEGLRPGETVVTRGTAVLTDGARVSAEAAK
jgi:membrane fusion protein, multidrug efflux system